MSSLVIYADLTEHVRRLALTLSENAATGGSTYEAPDPDEDEKMNTFKLNGHVPACYIILYYIMLQTE